MLDDEVDAATGAPPPSLLATCTMTLPVRIPLKMAMASECDRPDVEWPFTERISSPEEKEKGYRYTRYTGERYDVQDGRFG